MLARPHEALQTNEACQAEKARQLQLSSCYNTTPAEKHREIQGGQAIVNMPSHKVGRFRK